MQMIAANKNMHADGEIAPVRSAKGTEGTKHTFILATIRDLVSS